MQPRPLSNRALAHMLLLAVVAVWGATFPLVKAALQDTSPLVFNAVRMAIATIALIAINLRHLRHLSRASLRAGVVTGILLGAGYQLQTIGLAFTSASKSALITGMVVIFVPLFAIFPGVSSMRQSHSGWATATGSLLAFLGLALLTTAPGTKPAAVFSHLNRGDVLTLLCAVAFAAHLLALATFSSRVAAGPLATMQIGIATTLMLLSLPFGHTQPPHLTARLFVAWLVTAVFATAIAFTVQSWAQQHLPATTTAVLLSLEPVFALLTAKIFLGEHLSRRASLGAALILAGIATIEFINLPAPLSPEPVA